MTSVKKKVNQASESDLAKKAGTLYINCILKKYSTVIFFIKLGELGGSIGKTVLAGGTKLGQSSPVKSFSNTAEAISAQIDSDDSLNSHASSFILVL